MTRYYDEKCLQCDGCFFHAFDKYHPSGKPYEACRHYGYILNPKKGISKEECPAFMTPTQMQARIKMENARQERQNNTQRRK